MFVYTCMHAYTLIEMIWFTAARPIKVKWGSAFLLKSLQAGAVLKNKRRYEAFEKREGRESAEQTLIKWEVWN